MCTKFHSRYALAQQIWDTGGQERFRALVSSFYKGSDGCLLVFDVTEKESFLSLETWKSDFLNKIQSPVSNFPIIILGNKIDLEDRQVRISCEIMTALNASQANGVVYSSSINLYLSQVLGATRNKGKGH